MADQKTDLAIVIEAVNNASKQLNQVEKDLGSLNKSVEEQGATAQTAAMGFSSLVSGVALGGTVAIIAAGAFQKLTSFLAQLPGLFFSIAEGAGEIDQIGIAMHIVANNAGITAAEVDKVRDSVVDMNITSRAANTLLRDLIRNELDWAKATELAAAAQNIASATGFSTSETIERISYAISSGYPWMLKQLGLTEHMDEMFERYGETLGKTSEELTASERKMAVMNFVLEQGEKYTGAYEASMKSLSKVLGQTRDRMGEVIYQVGRIPAAALVPVIAEIKNFIEKILDWAEENRVALENIASKIGDFMRGVVGSIKSFVADIPWDALIIGFSYAIRGLAGLTSALRIAFNAAQIFIRGIQESIRTVQAFGSALSALARRDWQALKQVYTDWIDYSSQVGEAIMGDLEGIVDAFQDSYDMQTFDLKEWWKEMGETDAKGWEDKLKMAEDMGKKLTKEQSDKLKKMLRDLEKANRDYQQAVEKRAKQFEESFDDLVLTHRDAIEDLTEDLEEETKDYQEKLSDLVEDFDEAMKEIESRHKDKTESIMEDMEDERKKAEEEVEKITEKYNEATTLIEREAEARLGNLKAQLDKEKALGDSADKDKIAALEKMIAHEEKGLAETIEERKAKYDEEVGDVEEKLDDKLAKLQKELDEEDTLFTQAMAKRKAQYDEDVADAKESYEEKRLALQEELDEELAIREKYADDFARLADIVAEDDITRLVRKHEEEKAEMEREHQERLVDIKYSAFKEGEGFADSFATGVDTGYPAIKSQFNKIENDIDRLTAKAEGFTFGGGTSGGYGATGNWDWLPDAFGRAQHGGVFSKPTIVGEAGAEVVLPLNFPKRMAEIMKSLGMGGERGGGVIQNFYVTVSNPQDIDVLMERAGFALKQGGGHN